MTEDTEEAGKIPMGPQSGSQGVGVISVPHLWAGLTGTSVLLFNIICYIYSKNPNPYWGQEHLQVQQQNINFKTQSHLIWLHVCCCNECGYKTCSNWYKSLPYQQHLGDTPKRRDRNLQGDGLGYGTLKIVLCQSISTRPSQVVVSPGIHYQYINIKWECKEQIQKEKENVKSERKATGGLYYKA